MQLGKLVIGVETTYLTQSDINRLNNPSVGAVILFTRNYESPEQLKSLTTEIKSIRSPKLLITVDHEGGKVQRFKKNGFTHLPSLYDISINFNNDQTNTKNLLNAHATVLAYELQSCGVDLSFTPSVDLYNSKSKVINTRAFSAEPNDIVQIASAYILALIQNGMSSVIKHFPGHGSIIGDSHTEQAINTESFEDLSNTDLLPFKNLIKNNINLNAVMSAHVLYKNIDHNIPTFSKYWLKEILRHQLGFKGIVFSDDMGMFAATSIDNNPLNALIKFFNCGGDMALLCNDFDIMNEVLALSKINNLICDNLTEQKLISLYAKNTKAEEIQKLNKKYKESLKILSEFETNK